ncbi:MAG: B12-binding domain-containing radical SAM protein [Armatimonadota bacterium]
MKIALINICLRPYIAKAHFPLGFAYVAGALLQAGFDLDIIDTDAVRMTDDQLRDRLGQTSYDMIAFGTLVSGYAAAKKTAEIARQTNPQAVIVAGNSVASSVTEHLLTHTEVDIAVKGEGEKTIVNLAARIERGADRSRWAEVKGLAFMDGSRMVDTGYETPLNIDEVPFPPWEAFDIETYIRKFMLEVREPYPMPPEQIRPLNMNSARGCPFRCTFCYHVFQYCNYRPRKTESVVAEMVALQDRYGVNYVSFHDELTFVNKQHAEAFADAVLASGRKFCWRGDIRCNEFTRKDVDILLKLKESGCVQIGGSLESSDPAILKSMKKQVSVSEFAEQKKALDEAGIHTGTSVVLGYPQETLETIRATFDVCYDLGIYPSTGYLLPQPGTPMFEVAKQKGYVEDMETYLMAMGDRQDLRFNLTDIPNDVFEAEVLKNLQRIAEKLGLPLSGERLIKTGKTIATLGKGAS